MTMAIDKEDNVLVFDTRFSKLRRHSRASEKLSDSELGQEALTALSEAMCLLSKVLSKELCETRDVADRHRRLRERIDVLDRHVQPEKPHVSEKSEAGAADDLSFDRRKS